MFTLGQMIFALLFFAGFTVVLVAVYRKDRTWQRRQYRGVTWVFLGFVAFIFCLLVLKYIFNYRN